MGEHCSEDVEIYSGCRATTKKEGSNTPPWCRWQSKNSGEWRNKHGCLPTSGGPGFTFARVASWCRGVKRTWLDYAKEKIMSCNVFRAHAKGRQRSNQFVVGSTSLKVESIVSHENSVCHGDCMATVKAVTAPQSPTFSPGADEAFWCDNDNRWNSSSTMPTRSPSRLTPLQTMYGCARK